MLNNLIYITLIILLKWSLNGFIVQVGWRFSMVSKWNCCAYARCRPLAQAAPSALSWRHASHATSDKSHRSKTAVARGAMAL